MRLRRYLPIGVSRKPHSSLQPERLYIYLDALWRRRNVEGAVLEIGCWRGGTTLLAEGLLRRTGYSKEYVCVDTFSGFIPLQFAQDVSTYGTPVSDRKLFDRNSERFVRKQLDKHGASTVRLLRSDITQLTSSRLPESIAVCLIDVDLEEPVFAALEKVHPLLARGGTILVDDCPEVTTWAGARRAYSRFVNAHGLPERYVMGMGMIETAP